MSKLDKIFVKRYNVGIKGTSKFNELVPAQNEAEARRKYASRRNRKVSSNIINKR